MLTRPTLRLPAGLRDFAPAAATARLTGAAIRFVEPSSREVVAFSLEAGPRIAGLVPTWHRGVGGPLRFCCEGRVARRDPRARAPRKIIQARSAPGGAGNKN